MVQGLGQGWDGGAIITMKRENSESMKQVVPRNLENRSVRFDVEAMSL